MHSVRYVYSMYTFYIYYIYVYNLKQDFKNILFNMFF